MNMVVIITSSLMATKITNSLKHVLLLMFSLEI